jgi:hypothetical protein
MNIESRVQKLEEQTGLVSPGEPARLKTIFVIFDDPGVVDAHGNRTGAGPCDSHSATVAADLRQYHFERLDGETLEDFKNRLGAVPWGRKNNIKIIYMWSDGDCEPVPRIP